MTDPRQPLYDILGEAFNAGKEHVLLSPDEPSAASVLFPLAARMEEAVQKLVDAEREQCAMIAEEHACHYPLALGEEVGGWIAEEVRKRHCSLPSSPERETL